MVALALARRSAAVQVHPSARVQVQPLAPVQELPLAVRSAALSEQEPVWPSAALLELLLERLSERLPELLLARVLVWPSVERPRQQLAVTLAWDSVLTLVWGSSVACSAASLEESVPAFTASARLSTASPILLDRSESRFAALERLVFASTARSTRTPISAFCREAMSHGSTTESVLVRTPSHTASNTFRHSGTLAPRPLSVRLQPRLAHGASIRC